MRQITQPLVAAALSLLAVSAAWADVNVSYVKPEEFTDVPRNAIDRDRVLKELSAHFAELGRKLPAGQNLNIEVRDVDLAGRMIPRRMGGDDIRLMNGGADWPHMQLHYTLEANGQIIRSGDGDLSEMMYQQRYNRYSSGDSLRYEKQMVDEWFGKEFLRPQTASQ